jgi:peptide/nickel transport system ATP-binding protein
MTAAISVEPVAPSGATPATEAGRLDGRPGERGDLLVLREVHKYFPIRKGFLGKVVGQVRAVDGVSFSVKEGETLGLVGESGCGKTTTSRLIMRGYLPTSGEIRFRDQKMGWVDIPELDKAGLRQVRRNIQMIFQDPYSSLNPRMTLREIIGEPLLVNGVARGRALEDRVAELLRLVGLPPDYMVRYPHAFSGGQRQRIGIARALALRPQLVVCDEPVSALDVSIQAQTLNLLQDLQSRFGLTYVFVAHDLSVVQHVSRRVAVMYAGRLVEFGETADLFYTPRHPYTEALLSAVPTKNPLQRKARIYLSGEVADVSNPPSGCHFHPRCRYAVDRCRTETPALRPVPTPTGGTQLVDCHRAEELSLQGVPD